MSNDKSDKSDKTHWDGGGVIREAEGLFPWPQGDAFPQFQWTGPEIHEAWTENKGGRTSPGDLLRDAASQFRRDVDIFNSIPLGDPSVPLEHPPPPEEPSKPGCDGEGAPGEDALTSMIIEDWLDCIAGSSGTASLPPGVTFQFEPRASRSRFTYSLRKVSPAFEIEGKNCSLSLLVSDNYKLGQGVVEFFFQYPDCGNVPGVTLGGDPTFNLKTRRAGKIPIACVMGCHNLPSFKFILEAISEVGISFLKDVVFSRPMVEEGSTLLSLSSELEDVEREIEALFRFQFPQYLVVLMKEAVRRELFNLIVRNESQIAELRGEFVDAFVDVVEESHFDPQFSYKNTGAELL